MIIVTGGAGFIGSALVWYLNQRGYDDIAIVDSLKSSEKWKNLRALRYTLYLEKEEFLQKVGNFTDIEAILHMGACSSTTETDASYLVRNNYEYTRALVDHCLHHNIKLIYASSAATYGAGEAGYSDNENGLNDLRPLNMYGYSKQMVDQMVRKMGAFKVFTGLKFFNVYGPNEYHKGDMRSMVHKAWGQIQQSGTVRLFESHRKEYTHGEQVRDFVYIKDVVKVVGWMLDHADVGGLFNVGTGQPRSWNDLAKATFQSLGQPEKIEYIPMPEQLRDRYQYHTAADMRKLTEAGYTDPFFPLEEGIDDYVRNYLNREAWLGDAAIGVERV